jgi:hypothetical protein
VSTSQSEFSTVTGGSNASSLATVSEEMLVSRSQEVNRAELHSHGRLHVELQGGSQEGQISLTQPGSSRPQLVDPISAHSMPVIRDSGSSSARHSAGQIVPKSGTDAKAVPASAASSARAHADILRRTLMLMLQKRSSLRKMNFCCHF